MGRRNGRTVEVLTVLPVRHEEDEQQVQVGQEELATSIELHGEVFPAEQLVGWYATCVNGKPLSDTTVALHHFFEDKCDGQALHLSVDTSLKVAHLRCDAFVNSGIPMLADTLEHFTTVGVRMVVDEAARCGLDAMLRGTESFTQTEAITSLSSSLETLDTSMLKLKDMLSSAITYVDSVVAGANPPDAAIGRALADACSAVPHVDPDQFGAMFNTGLHDLLMVAYLSSVAQTHVTLAERLSRSIKPGQ